MQTTAIENILAWGEDYCREGELTSPEIYCWRPEKIGVVIGLSQTPAQEIDLENLRADNVALWRRQSGGGAVILTPSMLCFEALMPTDKNLSLRESFVFLTTPIRHAVTALTNYEVMINGISDLTINYQNEWRKFCGTAQLRKQKNILVHGTILLNDDLSLFSRYLRAPSETPAYRQNRAHHDFCLTLNTIAKITITELHAAIVHATTKLNWQNKTLPDFSTNNEVQNLLTNKYQSPQWNWHRKRSTFNRIDASAIRTK